MPPCFQLMGLYWEKGETVLILNCRINPLQYQHGETDAFRDAGRQLSYSNIIMVTTLAPCWYCSGLIRQFKIKTVIVGESVNFSGGVEWLKQNGVEIIDLNSDDCISMLANYIKDNSEIWNEDIGEE